jgi:hypothetical protein
MTTRLLDVRVWTHAAEPEAQGVAKRCQYFSTDQPGVGHCYWCAEGGLCPDEAVAASLPVVPPEPEATVADWLGGKWRDGVTNDGPEDS